MKTRKVPTAGPADCWLDEISHECDASACRESAVYSVMVGSRVTNRMCELHAWSTLDDLRRLARLGRLEL